MWRLILLTFLGASAHCTEVVRVVTWNLEWFPGRKPAATQAERDEHFKEVSMVLPQLRADVIVLQEVRNEAAAEQLAKELPGFKVHVTSRFQDGFSGTPGEQQITILSKFPADAAWAEAWKRGWANAPRGYVYARLQVSGKPLNVYGLHLKSNLGDPVKNTAKREDAAEQLLAHVKTQVKPGEAALVCGDFNTSYDQVSLVGDSTLRKFEQAGFFWTFEGIPHKDRITIAGAGRYPDACFDHIFTRELGRPVAQVLNIAGSDHRPVVVDIIVE